MQVHPFPLRSGNKNYIYLSFAAGVAIDERTRTSSGASQQYLATCSGQKGVAVIGMLPVFDGGHLEFTEKMVFFREAGYLLTANPTLLGQSHR